jgi:tRNA threonylcarbamoyladenosine biosynthesis protein TsaE
MKKFTVESTADLDNPAKYLVDLLQECPVAAFKGSMGAGKTTFIKSVCKALQCEDQGSSPTFSLVNEYSGPDGPIYHFDLYRIKSEEEAIDIGIYEFLDSGSICLIEWPEKIPDIMEMEPHILVNIDVRDSKRIITFEQQ